MKTKNIFKALALAMLMPAMVLTTACSNDDDLVNNENTATKGYALPVTINVSRQGDEGTTRATFNDGTKTLAFSSGDLLFVSGSDNSAGGAGKFGGTLTWVSDGTFTGTITTQNAYSGTADALLTAANSDGNVEALLLPNGYESYSFLSMIEGGNGYNDYCACRENKAFALSKAAAVEQFSYEYANSYSSGFALSPQKTILNFTITGLSPSTKVDISLKRSSFLNITGSVTTDGSGNATFAVAVWGNSDLNSYTLTVGGNDITLVNESKTLAAGKIYNITRAVTPPTLAQTMTTAGMTVKVKYNYDNENYCLFSSVGDGTYTFQSGYGYAGEDEDCAKALVVEGGKLVFKQNIYNTIDDLWNVWGFSVTFDTSNNTYSNWVGGSNYYNPSFISVEVNSVPIALTQKITVADLVKENDQSWSDIINNNSDKIKEKDDYVVRISDNAKLQRDMSGNGDWQYVRTDDDYQSMWNYKFEGD